jgi:hypothetical protein
MHYLGREAIAYPPHVGEKAINISVANELGLDPRIIDTLLQLPNITPHEDLRDSETGENLSDEQLAKVHEGDSTWWPGWMQGRDIFWRNGHLLDYRDDANLYQSRDPLKRWQERYSDGVPFEDSMLDWGTIPNSAIPLSFVGRPGYCLILVLDTATNRIAVLDTQGGGNADPFFEQFGWDDMKSDYKVPWMYNRKDMSVRLVSDLLLDFITRTANLEEGFVPGSVRSDYHFSPELSPPKWETWVRDRYLKLGWRPLAGLKACNSSRVEQPGKTFDPCDYEPMGGFETSSFDEQMRSLRHNITSRYLPDWYCPVPRQADVIERMKQRNWLTEDQIAYAESDEPIIPLNLEGWGGRLIYSSNNRPHF